MADPELGTVLPWSIQYILSFLLFSQKSAWFLLNIQVHCIEVPVDSDITCSPTIESLHISQWMTCVCVFVFDLERGQALETVYPPSCLPSETLDLIKFLAFPDSNTGIVCIPCNILRQALSGSKSSASVYPLLQTEIVFIMGQCIFGNGPMHALAVATYKRHVGNMISFLKTVGCSDYRPRLC